jgi:hypothetical protein
MARSVPEVFCAVAEAQIVIREAKDVAARRANPRRMRAPRGLEEGNEAVVRRNFKPGEPAAEPGRLVLR